MNQESTIQKWAEFGGVNKDSRVLDFACGTGFSSRTLSQITGCSSIGIDASDDAVEAAGLEAERSGLKGRLLYRKANLCMLPFPAQTFTHVLAGDYFGVMQNRDEALYEVARVLTEDGLLCVLNLPSETESLQYWNQFFQYRFSLFSEERCATYSVQVWKQKRYC